MDILYKTFRAEVRGVNAEEGTVDLMIPVSTNSVDRDGEVVEPSAFKKTLPKFMKRPVLVSSHDYHDLTSQIGEWTKLKISETGVEGKPKYYINEGNEQADWGFKLASKGMAAFSIGFVPKEWEDGEGTEKSPRRTYKEVELLEISQVIVPSNRDACQSVRSKSVDPIVNKLFDDVLADKELVTKPEETEDYIRISVDSGDHEGHRIRTIDVFAKDGIKALYCGTEKKIITYLFAKANDWTMAKARAWIKEHEKSVIVSVTTNSVNEDEIIMASVQSGDITLRSPQVTQAGIIDEIDYLKALINKAGLNDDTRAALEEFAKSVWGELIKMDMDKMKMMHSMMDKMEKMAGDAKKMTEDAMEDMKSRSPGNDIPVKDTITVSDISEAIRRLRQG